MGRTLLLLLNLLIALAGITAGAATVLIGEFPGLGVLLLFGSYFALMQLWR